MLRAWCSVCLFAVLAAFTSTPAYGQTGDYRTYFTFNTPVTLPGVTLPAGKYVFRILDHTGSRRMIQVQDVAGRHYGTMMSMPMYRDDVASEPEVRFMEGMEGTVPAVRAWWYPGASIGYEFVYPREQAMLLAQRTKTPVLTNTDVPMEEPKHFDVPPAIVPPFADGAAPLTPWLGAMSLAMGALAHKGPQLRM